MYGTLGPTTVYEAAKEHPATLRQVGACYLPHGGLERPSAAVGGPSNFVADVARFIDGDAVSERSAEPSSD